MDFYQFKILTSPPNVEILQALMGHLHFEAFEETQNGFNAYLSEKDFTPGVETELTSLADRFDFSFSKSLIPDQNWNKIWEESFNPVIVGSFCSIRADFHPPLSATTHELIINPKMAFGTGHHETTFMVVSAMKDIPFEGKKVLDFGCGTGVLAILASRLGALKTDAVDIELPSYENTKENAILNQVNNIKAYHGTLKEIKEKDYDVILANINRNVILEALETLYHLLAPKGTLVISGFLKQDEHLLLDKTKQQHFIPVQTTEKNDWICMVLQKETK